MRPEWCRGSFPFLPAEKEKEDFETRKGVAHRFPLAEYL